MELNSEYCKSMYPRKVDVELKKAQLKHPNFPEDMFKQVAIINEESGEITKAVLHYHDEGGSLEDIKKELIQTAAMCMRMLNAIEIKDNYLTTKDK